MVRRTATEQKEYRTLQRERLQLTLLRQLVSAHQDKTITPDELAAVAMVLVGLKKEPDNAART